MTRPVIIELTEVDANALVLRNVDAPAWHMRLSDACEKGLATMTRPAIYLPALTDEELVRFVSQYGGTELEQDLARRLASNIDEHEGLQEDLDTEIIRSVDLCDRIDALEEELKHCQ